MKPLLYALAPSTGWKKQSKEEAKKEAKDAINFTGWRCWKEKGEQNPEPEALANEAINNASKDTKRRANDILTNYPDLVPKVTLPPQVDLPQLKWPEETNIKWCQIFRSEPPAPQYWGLGVGVAVVRHHDVDPLRAISDRLEN